MPQAERFSFGGFWLDRESKSPYWQRCWYDPAARKVRRRSLATSDFEDAKIRLAAFVYENPEKPAEAPEETLLVVVLKAYWEAHSDFKTRPSDARRAGGLLLDYLGDEATLADLSRARQEGFMRWLVSKHGLSVATISKYLSFICAALRRAAEPHMVTGPDGKESERRLITLAPKIYYQTAHIAQVVDKPEPLPRAWRPSLTQLGSFIDDIRSEALLRYTLLALNTWARPQAICDIDPALQLDRETWRLDLNPPGRRQNKKYRPLLPVTDCLRGWLAVWPQQGRLVANARSLESGPSGGALEYAYRPVACVRHAFKNTRERAGVPQMTRYALRHLMASRASGDASVPAAQIDTWMGHARPGPRSARWYHHLEPGYLREAKEFTDRFMVELQQHCQRSLFAPAEASDYRPLIYQKPEEEET